MVVKMKDDEGGMVVRMTVKMLVRISPDKMMIMMRYQSHFLGGAVQV